MNLIRRVWRGEEVLALTFWVWGFAVNVVLKGIFLLVVAMAEKNPTLASVLLALFLVSLGYQVFISVAVWRSANRFDGYKGWAILAKTMVVLGIVQTLLSLTGNM